MLLFYPPPSALSLDPSNHALMAAIFSSSLLFFSTLFENLVPNNCRIADSSARLEIIKKILLKKYRFKHALILLIIEIVLGFKISSLKMFNSKNLIEIRSALYFLLIIKIIYLNL